MGALRTSAQERNLRPPIPISSDFHMKGIQANHLHALGSLNPLTFTAAPSTLLMTSALSIPEAYAKREPSFCQTTLAALCSLLFRGCEESSQPSCLKTGDLGRVRRTCSEPGPSPNQPSQTSGTGTGGGSTGATRPESRFAKHLHA